MLRHHPHRWLFSPGVDVAIFAGSALASALIVGLAPRWGLVGETPPWAWLLFVVGIDVAHVWSTLFRVYLDGAELRRRPVLYAGAPVLAYALGVAAHQLSPEAFWRVLAYVAVWHFVRQQAGWMTLYGRRAGSSVWQLRFDAVAIYAATLGPLVWWHANLPRAFWWFREGDFVPSLPGWVGEMALVAHGLVLVVWLVGAVAQRALHPGKGLLLLATWVAWFGGIVLARDDFSFTVMNVMLHGVPYLVMLFRYMRARRDEGGYGFLRAALRFGVPVFMGLLVALAFAEELAWDTLVWHERPMFFGRGGFELGSAALSLVVPLLALPQTTHYLLDGFVWRTRDDPSLARRLGWASDEIIGPDDVRVGL